MKNSLVKNKKIKNIDEININDSLSEAIRFQEIINNLKEIWPFSDLRDALIPNKYIDKAIWKWLEFKKINIDDLKPIQEDFKQAKTMLLTDDKFKDIPIIIDEKNNIIDWHHRYLYLKNKWVSSINTYKFIKNPEYDIKDLIKLAKWDYVEPLIWWIKTNLSEWLKQIYEQSNKSKILIENKISYDLKWLIDESIKEQVIWWSEAKYTYWEQLKKVIIDLDNAKTNKQILNTTKDIDNWIRQWIWWERISKYPSLEKAIDIVYKNIIDKRNNVFWIIDLKWFDNIINQIKERNDKLKEKTWIGNNKYEETIKNLEILKEQAKNPWQFWLYEFSEEPTFLKQLHVDIKSEIKRHTDKWFWKDIFIERIMNELKEFYIKK